MPIGNGETFSEFLALPKDSKPVTSWSDTDTAFDDAVGAIRNMLVADNGRGERPARVAEPGVAVAAPAPKSAGLPDLLGIATKPTDLDRDRFLRSGFMATATLFELKLAELKESEPRVDTDFERIDTRSFAASVYVDGTRAGQVSIWHGSDTFRNALCLSYDATSGRNSMNDWLAIEDTSHGLAFGASNAMSRVKSDDHLDIEGAAAYFWESFLAQVRSRLR